MLSWASSEFGAKGGAGANTANKWSPLAFLARWLVQISAAAGISKLNGSVTLGARLGGVQ